MKDYLQDLVQHTHSLGNIDLIKVTGDQNETVVNAIAEDRSVVLEAKFKHAVPDFIGLFGMPNLGKLNTILNIPEYKEGAAITVTRQNRNGTDVPTGVHFSNKTGDFNNDYRFMQAEVVTEKLKNVTFKGAKWVVDFMPSAASIQRMKFQASANSEILSFVTKTENGNLVFYFGDAASHAGSFVFEQHVSGKLSTNWAWPVGAVLNILGLPGDKTFKISDTGAAMITVDSGLADYSYIIPAQTK